jgi:hypothetical protein
MPYDTIVKKPYDNLNSSTRKKKKRKNTQKPPKKPTY